MTKITIKPDCDNSPKLEFIKNFNIAFAEVDLKFIENSIEDDISWEIVREKHLKGKDKML